MPWKETQVMDQRVEFAMRAVGCVNFGALCREYGISRKTGYKWRERFVAHGLAGMAEESRAPRGHAGRLGEEVVCAMVALKVAHRHWGPRKIRELYARKHKGAALPSESSFKRVLARAGLTVRRKVRPSKKCGRISSGRKANAPSEVWSVDFKGSWNGQGGERVEPLTVRDEYSRFVLDIRLLANSRTESVRAAFERLFELHGLPEAIRSDNGTPFASTQSVLGLSRLSAWWLALGIDLERSRPGCPQDNGAHERLHLDIRRELEAGRMGRDQHAFDLWREEFNRERPHEALAMATPAEIYHPSQRLYNGTPEALDYGAMSTRQIDQYGKLRYHGEQITISSALARWNVGIAPQEDGRVEIWFAHLLLGHIDPQTAAFNPIQRSCHDSGAHGRGADYATLHRPLDHRRENNIAFTQNPCHP